MRNLEQYGKMCIENLNAIGIYPNKVESFTVNTRAKKRWGQTQRKDGKYYININIELLNEKSNENGLIETIYHELLHCVDGCMNHGSKWQDLAELVSDCYNVDITRCSNDEKKLGVEYANELRIARQQSKKEFKIKCCKCGKITSRLCYRKPKWYSQIERYNCVCGGELIRL